MRQGRELSPVWSHDSRSVTYGINEPALLRQRIGATEAEAETIFTPDAQASPQDYSLHDDLLLFDQERANGRRPTAFLLTLADRDDDRILERRAAKIFSRVSRQTARCSRSPRTSRAVQKSTSGIFRSRPARSACRSPGGIQPIWRRDGRELFFLSPEGGLMAASDRTEGLSWSQGILSSCS